MASRKTIIVPAVAVVALTGGWLLLKGKLSSPKVAPAAKQAPVVKTTPPAPVCSVRAHRVGHVDRKGGLWGISTKMYGDSRELKNYKLARVNAGKYRTLATNPDHIEVGWILTIPCLASLPALDKKWVAAVSRKERPAVATQTPHEKAVQLAERKVEAAPEIKPVCLPCPPCPETAPKEDTKPAVRARIEVVPAPRVAPAQKPVIHWAESQKPPPQSSTSLANQSAPTLKVAQKEFVQPIQRIEVEVSAGGPKKGKNTMKNVLTAPFRTVAWPFMHPKKTLRVVAQKTTRYGGTALGFNPDLMTRTFGVGLLTAISMLTPSAKNFAFAAPVAVEKAEVSVPTREEVETAGSRPQLRYMVPAGDLNWVSNSVFQQPSYGENRKAIEAMPRDTAASLRLVGARVYNEWPGQVAPEVVLTEKAVVIYQLDSQKRPVPLYLADCRYKGKPWANRIKLISVPPPPAPPVKTVQQTPPPQAQNSQATAQPTQAAVTNNMNVPATINLNLSGLPQQQAPPTETTQHIIYELKRDRWAKAKDGGFAIMGAGVGVGAAALGIRLPAALENSAHANAGAVKHNADRNLDIANVQRATASDVAIIKGNTARDVTTIQGANAMNVAQIQGAAAQAVAATNAEATTQAATVTAGATVQASENIKIGMQTRNPDVTNVKNVGVNNPSTTVSPTTSVNPTIAPVNNNTARGGEGGIGMGGQGGEGGGGGGGGSSSVAPITVVGGSATTGSATSSSTGSSTSTTGSVNATGGTIGPVSAVSGSASGSVATGGTVSGSGNSNATGGSSNATGGAGGNVSGSGNSTSTSGAASGSTSGAAAGATSGSTSGASATQTQGQNQGQSQGQAQSQSQGQAQTAPKP